MTETFRLGKVHLQPANAGSKRVGNFTFLSEHDPLLLQLCSAAERYCLTMAARQFLGMSGQGTTVTTIYMPALKEMRLATPIFREQTEIVRRVEALFAFADRLEVRLAHAETAIDRLTPALLAKAFRGELAPQDPNDEPAVELLARLRRASTVAGDASATKQPRSRIKKAA